jgi:hypothetical protein
MTDFKQTGKFSGNEELNVIEVVSQWNIVIDRNPNQTSSGYAIACGELNMRAFASQTNFNHFAPCSSSG